MASFALIEAQKTSLIARVGSWPEVNLNFRPNPAEWSAIEVLDHLVLTEFSILNAARSGIVDPGRIGLSDRLRTAFIWALFRSPARVKVPRNVTQIVPGPNSSFAEVLARWENARAELAEFLENSPTHQLHRGIFKHPVGGWMNCNGILNFFSVHMIHHGYQIERLSKRL